MMVYAMIDNFVTSSNPGYGFANTKKAIAFVTLAEMNTFIEARYYDYSAKRISRRVAMTMLEKPYGSSLGGKGLLVGSSDFMEAGWVTLRDSAY